LAEKHFKKDETPYLVFVCKKCRQYLYVKTTQKSKKCLRCGFTHKVSSILDNGEMIEGMTAAVDFVKKRQNELAIKELGHTPEFRAFGDFKVTTLNPKNQCRGESDSKFEELLEEISTKYKKFPLYIIEIMAENYGITNADLKDLIKSFKKQGVLVQVNSYSYMINKKRI
jgi:hypothetical protein